MRLEGPMTVRAQLRREERARPFRTFGRLLRRYLIQGDQDVAFLLAINETLGIPVEIVGRCRPPTS